MDQDGKYIFPAEQRRALEALPMAFAAYQLVNDRVVTLLVSDGMCKFWNTTRTDLIFSLDHDMFGRVHPDDVEMLAKLGYRFATKEGPYDIVYRAHSGELGKYRYIHAVGKHQAIETGVKIAYISYADISDYKVTQAFAHSQIESPKTRFLDENMGAMAVVTREKKHLLYYNQALTRLLPPRMRYDSGISFDQFFFGDSGASIEGLFAVVDTGSRIVEEPLTKRKIEVSVVSSTWDAESAYVVYFYEHLSCASSPNAETELRHKRIAFNNIMFEGVHNNLDVFDHGYKGFRVWNLTQNTLILNEGSNRLFHKCENSFSFDCYLKYGSMLCADKEVRSHLYTCSREKLMQLFESGTYPRIKTYDLQTDQGRLSLELEITMMVSPDNGELYLKISETNITNSVILNTLIARTVENEYDYIAYSDLDANLCHIVSGKASASGQKSYIIRTTDFIQSPSDIRTFPSLFPAHVKTLDDMHNYLLEVCDEHGTYTTTQELPCGVIKSIYFELIDPEHRSFYIRCKDVTELLRIERERKYELEQAVRAEHEKVEHVLLQTVLSISNALDARDPITNRHSQRVAQYSAEVARRLGWPEERVQNLRNVALVHDIGKIGIPDTLLQKSGKLTDKEYLQIQDHVAIGGFILKDFTAIDKVAEGALFHHERYDGKGYPRGLAGEQIPIEARIIGIADAVDAMNSTRPYRARQSEAYIRGELTAGRSKQFDPALVDVLLKMIDDGVLSA